MNTATILGILIPFVGTSLGAAMVFVLRKEISTNLQKVLTGFAAGVMPQIQDAGRRRSSLERKFPDKIKQVSSQNNCD